MVDQKFRGDEILMDELLPSVPQLFSRHNQHRVVGVMLCLFLLENVHGVLDDIDEAVYDIFDCWSKGAEPCYGFFQVAPSRSAQQLGSSSR